MPQKTQHYIDVELPEGGARRLSVSIKSLARSRSFKIRLADAGTVLLTKPKYAPMAEALEFLNGSRGWLAKQLASAAESVPLADYLKSSPELYGAENRLELVFINSRTSPFYTGDFESSKLVFAVREGFEGADSEKLFLQYAAAALPELVLAEARRTGLQYARVSVRDQSGRWGSRSSSGTLSLNWRVMLLPPPLRRYIICHELAHTRFMDHSVSFWIFLNRICPGAQKLDAQVGAAAKKIFNITLAKG